MTHGKLFGTDGIRGVAGEPPLDHETVRAIGNALATTLAEDLDQASGFGLRLILAHQFPSQLSGASEHGKRLLRSLMTNARNKIVFGGIGSPEDLEPLVDYLYMGALDPDEVKHMLSTTKVLEYREEMRRAYGHAEGSSWGGGWSCGSEEKGGEAWPGNGHRTLLVRPVPQLARKAGRAGVRMHVSHGREGSRAGAAPGGARGRGPRR